MQQQVSKVCTIEKELFTLDPHLASLDEITFIQYDFVRNETALLYLAKRTIYIKGDLMVQQYHLFRKTQQYHLCLDVITCVCG